MTPLKRSHAVEKEEPSKRHCVDRGPGNVSSHHLMITLSQSNAYILSQNTPASTNPPSNTPSLPNNQPLRPQPSYHRVNLERLPLENLLGVDDWMERAGTKLDRPHLTKLEMIPGIPFDSVRDFANEPMVYIAKDILELRHLRIPARHYYYFEFQRLGDILKSVPNDSLVFWDRWEQLKTLTQQLQRDELDLYRRYIDRAYGEEIMGKNGKKKPLMTWDRFRKYQTEPIRIDQFGRYHRTFRRKPVGVPSSDVSNGTKRSAGHLEDSDAQVPTKKPRLEDSEPAPVDLTDEPELPPLPPLVFNTHARDQMHRHKQGKATDEHPAYKAEHKEARTGACADYPWMAENDETEQRYQHQEALRNGAAPRARGFTKEENQKLDYWKREWSGDEQPLPYHPFPNVEDYTPNEEGVYQCFHKDFNCAEGTCRHPCCKTGYDVKGLKKAIAKAIRTYKAQVERMIESGELDRRHKTWPNWCDDRLRKRENEKKAANAARVAEETERANAINDRPVTETSPEAVVVTAAASAALTARQGEEREAKIKADMKAINQCYQRARFCEERKQYPNLALLEAWWAATRKATQLLHVTPEERTLLDSPEPSALSDKKPVLQKTPSVQPTPEQLPLEESAQEDNGFDPLFDDPPDGMEPEAEEPQQEEEAYDPLFDEPPDSGSNDAGEAQLNDAELDEYLI